MQVFFKIYLFFYVLIKHTQKYIDEFVLGFSNLVKDLVIYLTLWLSPRFISIG